jgi:hypothetical protein
MTGVLLVLKPLSQHKVIQPADVLLFGAGLSMDDGLQLFNGGFHLSELPLIPHFELNILVEGLFVFLE